MCLYMCWKQSNLSADNTYLNLKEKKKVTKRTNVLTCFYSGFGILSILCNSALIFLSMK